MTIPTPDPTTVIFYYDIAKFFEISKLESQYRTQFDLDKNGISSMDERVLSDMDSALYGKLLRRAAGECYAHLQSLCKGKTEGFGYDTLPVRTVEALNALVSPEEDLHFKVSDAGTLDYGSLAVVANDIVYFDGTDWVKDNASTLKYIFFTLDLPWNFDLNNQFGFDNKIEEFITMFTLREWFRRQRFDTAFIEAELEQVSTELSRILNYRVSVRRPVRTF